MRLIDIVLQSPVSELRQEEGRTVALPAAGSLAPALRTCALRYILDRPASRQCAELMFQPDGPLAHPDELTRLPDKPFWLEFYPADLQGGEPAGSAARRIGFHVQPRDEGSAGSIMCVAETVSGEACLVAGSIEFDLAGRVPAAQDRGFRIRNDDVRHFDWIFDRARLLIDDRWRSHARFLPGDYRDFLALQAELSWAALPFAMTFSALLAARSALVQRASSLARLNAARARAGKPALAEHVEVSLNLTPSPAVPRNGGSPHDRQPPRLHFVRGHNVTRAGRTFWRTSHFRGDGLVEATRTVTVTARPVALGSARGSSGPSQI